MSTSDSVANQWKQEDWQGELYMMWCILIYWSERWFLDKFADWEVFILFSLCQGLGRVYHIHHRTLLVCLQWAWYNITLFYFIFLPSFFWCIQRGWWVCAFWWPFGRRGGHVCTCFFFFRLPPVSCVMIFLYEFWVNLEIPVTELAQVIAALGFW